MSNPVVKIDSKLLGTLYGRKLIKASKAVKLYEPMDGFGMPQVIIDSITSAGSWTTHQVSGKLRKNVRVLHEFDIVEIHYLHTVYQASVKDFKEYGILFTEAGSSEAQYVLPRKYFTAIDSTQLTII